MHASQGRRGGIAAGEAALNFGAEVAPSCPGLSTGAEAALHATYRAKPISDREYVYRDQKPHEPSTSYRFFCDPLESFEWNEMRAACARHPSLSRLFVVDETCTLEIVFIVVAAAGKLAHEPLPKAEAGLEADLEATARIDDGFGLSFAQSTAAKMAHFV